MAPGRSPSATRRTRHIPDDHEPIARIQSRSKGQLRQARGTSYPDPVWAAAQDAELPISFHIGSGDVSGLMLGSAGLGVRTGMARLCTQLFMENANCIADIIYSGICHRFPKLDFVSVESGVSWLMFALESFDWQWQNNGVASEHPEFDLLPSEYFKRQIYGCFWFETDGVRAALEKYPDNIFYETDFPHPTSMAPGPKLRRILNDNFSGFLKNIRGRPLAPVRFTAITGRGISSTPWDSKSK